MSDHNVETSWSAIDPAATVQCAFDQGKAQPSAKKATMPACTTQRRFAHAARSARRVERLSHGRVRFSSITVGKLGSRRGAPFTAQRSFAIASLSSASPAGSCSRKVAQK